MILKVLGPRRFAPPFAIGHECVAEVVACGEAVTRVEPGQLVVVPWAISCGECQRCQSGLTSHCAAHPETMISAYGFGEPMGDWGGMVSDLVRVPHADGMLVKIPNGVAPLALAGASDNIPDAWRTVAPQLRRWPGSRVLVAAGGAPSIGLYAAGIAVALGAVDVDYVDWQRERLAIAADLGANPIELPRNGTYRAMRKLLNRTDRKYCIAVDTTASRSGLENSIRALDAGGICTSVGYYFERRVPIPFMHMYVNNVTFQTGLSNPRADLPNVIELISSKRFVPERVATLVADWEDAHEAFLERTTKVVVTRPRLHLSG